MFGKYRLYVVPELELICSGTRRWSLFTLCVTEDSRTSANLLTAEFVVTAIVPPNGAVEGAEFMLGRVAGVPSELKR